jgi:SAM-dependent methyltransferase
MPDVIHELYEKQAYPPMSHPLSDPAVTAVAARIAGLDVPHPRRARILEIGCCSGHNLIPLAQRWPESRFTGIDLAVRSIAGARDRAARAGLGNVEFHAVDLREFAPTDGPFDFIIAHGFFSWVRDDAKAALLVFCHKHLSANGIATVSFNLECGWKPRLPVIAKARAIQQAGGVDEVSALEILKSVTPPDAPEIAIIDDMLAKGAAILPFDDFSPVNDPWPLDRVVRAATNAGLRWLGESDPGENLPSELSEEFLVELRNQVRDPLAYQLAVDEALGRTFRSGVLCRADAAVAQRLSLEKALEFSVRAGEPPTDAADRELFQTVESFAPACVPVRQILPGGDVRSLSRQLHDGITRGWLRPRIEPVGFDPEPPDFPRLDAFRLLCAREHLPLVDAWHKPCAFPQSHHQVLAAMDGSRSREELAALSKVRCPELAFDPWLRHLAWRGMFA